MDILLHGSWAGAAIITTNRSAPVRMRIGWAVLWAGFPGLLAFGPSTAVGAWLRLASGANAQPEGGHLLLHVHVGPPLYDAGHSLISLLIVFYLVSILARWFVLPMLGWLLHILIDIPVRCEP